MTIQPYNPEPHCPKCQSGQISARYDGTFTTSETSEYLRRICDTCGYEWLEQCADAEKTTAVLCKSEQKEVAKKLVE